MAEADVTENEPSLFARALNPIGALVLERRLAEASGADLERAFDELSPHTLFLLLSRHRYDIFEVFICDESISCRLGDCLAVLGWTEMERLLSSSKSLHLFHAILGRKHTTLARSLVRTVPHSWWPRQVSSLLLLAKVIDNCDAEAVAPLVADQELMGKLWMTPEGFYCALRLLAKRMDQADARDVFYAIISRAVADREGGRALVDAILYGDVLVNEMIQLLCARSETYECDTAGSLVTRLLDLANASARSRILECLCSPKDAPLISRIRASSNFSALLSACRRSLTQQQYDRLRCCLDSEEAVDRLVQVEAGVIAVEVNKKRRLEHPPAVPVDAAKKARATVQSSAGDDSHPAPSHDTTTTVVPPPPPPAGTPSTTVAPVAPVSTPIHSAGTKSGQDLQSLSAPVASSLLPAPFYDGEDVTAMAMSEKSYVVLNKLATGSSELRATIFDALRGDLLALIMNERGTLIVQWFVLNGTPAQREIVEGRVVQVASLLVRSGGYGRQRVREIIDRCENVGTRAELERRFEKAMTCVRQGEETGTPSGSIEDIVVDGEREEKEKEKEKDKDKVKEKEKEGEEVEIISVALCPSTSAATTPRLTAPSTKAPGRADVEIVSVVPAPVRLSLASATAPIPSRGSASTVNNNAPKNPRADQLAAELDVITQFYSTGKPWDARFKPAQLLQSCLLENCLKDPEASHPLSATLQSEFSKWIVKEDAALFLRELARRKSTCGLMIQPAVASLHALHTALGSDILRSLLTRRWRADFLDACKMGGAESAFVRVLALPGTSCIAKTILEHSEIITGSLTRLGLTNSLRPFILEHARKIAESESGREFLNFARTKYADVHERLSAMGIAMSSCSSSSQQAVASTSSPPPAASAAAASAAASPSSSSPLPAAAAAATASAAAVTPVPPPPISGWTPTPAAQQTLAARLTSELDKIADCLTKGAKKRGRSCIANFMKSLLIDETFYLQDSAARAQLEARLTRESEWWTASPLGVHLYTQLAFDNRTRPIMIQPVCPSLHKFTGEKNVKAVQCLASSPAFLQACVQGGDKAPFVRMLTHKDTWRIAKGIFDKAEKRGSLIPFVRLHGRRIAATDSGLEFLKSLPAYAKDAQLKSIIAEQDAPSSSSSPAAPPPLQPAQQLQQELQQYGPVPPPGLCVPPPLAAARAAQVPQQQQQQQRVHQAPLLSSSAASFVFAPPPPPRPLLSFRLSPPTSNQTPALVLALAPAPFSSQTPALVLAQPPTAASSQKRPSFPSFPWNGPEARGPFLSSAFSSFRGNLSSPSPSSSSLSQSRSRLPDSFRQLCVERVIKDTLEEIVKMVAEKVP